MNSYLFNDFERITHKVWKQKIQADLKGLDYNDNLLWKTSDGIVVKPFYTKEDRTGQEILTSENNFNICQTIYVDKEDIANGLAKDALLRGANAIEFEANNEFDFRVLLKNIDTKEISIFFKLNFLSPNFIKELASFVNSQNLFFNIDTIGNLAKTGNWFFNLKEDHKKFEDIITATQNSICVNASIYQNAGANIVQQLAYALAHANEYLNNFGATAAAKIHFNFSIGSNYFFEIAKVRAFRILWKSLLHQYNIENTIPHIFTQPTLRNKTLYDYNVNMLRTTSECMSAILGGSNTISNVSYDEIFHKSNEFGERVSRNQLLILNEESGFNNAQNFADGTYYIESITNQLAEKALVVFKLIEEGGGFLKQLKEGIIQKKITETAQKEQELFDTNKLVLLGTNTIQNENDSMKNDLELFPFVKKRVEKTLLQPIIQKRLAEKLEQERLDNE